MATTGKIRSNAIGIFISNESANSGTFSGGTYGDNTSENDTWEIVARAPEISERTFKYLKQLNGFYEIDEDQIIYWTQWLMNLCCWVVY